MSHWARRFSLPGCQLLAMRDSITSPQIAQVVVMVLDGAVRGGVDEPATANSQSPALCRAGMPRPNRTRQATSGATRATSEPVYARCGWQLQEPRVLRTYKCVAIRSRLQSGCGLSVRVGRRTLGSTPAGSVPARPEPAHPHRRARVPAGYF